MEKALVSIIVPVYNAAEYLPQCLRSLQEQTWSNIEVWLVDDGSCDDSLMLCRQAAKADSRFRVIHQENKGVSAARNAALAHAKGKYIQFADSDDYLPLDATEILVSTAYATGADLTVAHFYRVAGESIVQRGHIKHKKVFSRRDFAAEMMKAPANFYYGVLWNKLYRRKLIADNKLFFEENLNWCEDFLYNLEYIKYARLIAAVPQPVYYYIKRDNSLTSRNSLRKMLQTKKVTFAYYKDLYQALELYEARKARVYSYLLSGAADGRRTQPEGLDRLKKQFVRPKKLGRIKEQAAKERNHCGSS